MANKLRVLICDLIDLGAIELLDKKGVDVDYEPDIDQKSLMAKAGEYDGIVVRGRTKINRDVIDAALKLRVIGRVGVGLDNIEVGYAKDKGITVVSAPRAPTSSVAELAVALILSVLRKVPYADSEMKKGNWVKKKLVGLELTGKKVGIIGVGGRIGFEVAKILKNGFNVKIIGYDVIDLKDKVKILDMKVAESLEQLLTKSDIISIHVPYTPSTHHLINQKKINFIKNGAVLINTSRGDLIDGQAVLEALREGKLSGVGLDVFHKEPPVDEWEKELVNLVDGRVVTTCHIGSQTIEAQKKASFTVAEEVLKVLQSS